VFETGFALFDDFTDETGVPLEPRFHPETGAHMQPLAPALADTEAAWKVYGAAFLAMRGRQSAAGETLWALKQFGEPAYAC
jgi:hypothetical protein